MSFHLGYIYNAFEICREILKCTEKDRVGFKSELRDGGEIIISVAQKICVLCYKISMHAERVS